MRIRKLVNPVHVYRNRWRIYSRAERKASQLFESKISNTFVSIAEATPLLRNRRRLLGLQSRHQGQRCFIIGNGPSLQIADLEKLVGEVTFASNKIYLAFNQTEWRPTYYTVVDVLVAEQNKQKIGALELNKIFAADIRLFMPYADGVIWVPSLSNPVESGNISPQFSTDLTRGAYGGWTVIYLQLQIAFYMGIREVYLLGMDFQFRVPEPTGEISLQGPVLEHHGESNHFHPDYRFPGEKWTMPRLDIQRKAFTVAKQAFETHEGSILNASRKTALDVFPEVNLDEVVVCRDARRA